MKIKFYILCILAFTAMCCTKDFILPNDVERGAQTRAGEMEGEVFYYYGYEDKKIFLNYAKDQILVKFTTAATKEHLNSVVNSNASLRPEMPNPEEYFVDGYSFNTVVLEGKNISSDVLNSLKVIDGVASVTYMLEYKGSLSGITDEFIVKLKEGTSYDQLQELAAKNDFITGKEDEFVKNQYMLYVSKTSEMDAMQAANLFYETGLFEFAEPNLIDFNAENSLDPLFPYQWGLKNTGQSGGTSGVDIKVEQAWTITKGSPNIRVAVIDAGVDLTHPDLQGNLLAGYDATGHGTGGGTYNNYNDVHGTPVAGIIGALQNNLVGGSYEGISGVAPNCKIVPVKASVNGNFNRDHASAAINWVSNNDKAEIINCSFSDHTVPTTNLTVAILNAIAQGCVVVFSSGNYAPFSEVSYPANIHSVITVGAIDRTGTRSVWNSAEQSNYGSELDVVAPGTAIYTTDIQWDLGYNTSTGIRGNYYLDFKGTSAAAPYVSGVAALILSAYPNLTPQQVANRIEKSAQKVGPYTYSTTSGRPNGTWNSQTGYGLVNAYAAMATPIIGPNDLNIQSIQNYYLENRPSGSITWEVSGNKFTISPTTGNAITVSTTNATGTGTITAKVNGTVVATKSITVSSIPTLGPMTGPNVVQPGQTYVSYRLNLVSGLIYNWGSSEGILTEVGVIGDSEGLFDVSSSSGTGTDTVHCTVKTTNGTTVGVFYMNVYIY